MRLGTFCYLLFSILPIASAEKMGSTSSESSVQPPSSSAANSENVAWNSARKLLIAAKGKGVDTAGARALQNPSCEHFANAKLCLMNAGFCKVMDLTHLRAADLPIPSIVTYDGLRVVVKTSANLYIEGKNHKSELDPSLKYEAVFVPCTKISDMEKRVKSAAQ